ncbi:MAG: SGNH/GDSL hydrolase family protein [Chitinophagales bacterium]
MNLRSNLILIIVLIVLALLITPQLAMPETFSVTWYLLRSALLLASIFFVGKGLIVLIKSTKSAAAIKNSALSVAVIVVLLLMVELVMQYIPISHGNNQAYCSRLWFQWYWHLNQEHYRDREYTDADMAPTMRKIFCIGDSYTAGHGIKHPVDRFSDLLAARLSPRFAVFNFGQNGSNTPDELRRLLEVPVKPDLVIWQHCLNDIDYLRPVTTASAAKPVAPIGRSILGAIAPYSFLANYVFWLAEAHDVSKKAKQQSEQAHQITNTSNPLASLRELFYQNHDLQQLLNQSEFGSYLDTVTRNAHINDLLRVDSICSSHQVKVLFLFFPGSDNLSLKALGDGLNQEMIAVLTKNGANCLSAFPAAMQLEERKRVASPLDGHPSEAWHALVADALYGKLNELGWIR